MTIPLSKAKHRLLSPQRIAPSEFTGEIFRGPSTWELL